MSLCDVFRRLLGAGAGATSSRRRALWCVAAVILPLALTSLPAASAAFAAQVPAVDAPGFDEVTGFDEITAEPSHAFEPHSAFEPHDAGAPDVTGEDHLPAQPDVNLPVVFVGVGGLQWSDIDQHSSPQLWQLIARADVASMALQSLSHTCSLDAWLSISAGQWVSGLPASYPLDGSHEHPELSDDPSGRGYINRCQALSEPVAQGYSPEQGYPAEPGFEPAPGEPGEPIEGLPSHAAWIDTGALLANPADQASLGVLGDAAAASAQCVLAVGPGAALAVATSDGRVPLYLPLDVLLADAADEFSQPGQLQQPDQFQQPGQLPPAEHNSPQQDLAALAQAIQDCPITVVDAGDLSVHPALRAQDLARVDAVIGQLLDLLPDEGQLIVSGIADSPAGPRGLQATVTYRPASPAWPAWTVSDSARRDALVVLGDVSATLLHAVGGDISGVDGAVLRSGPARHVDVTGTVESQQYVDVLTDTTTGVMWLLAASLAVTLTASGLLLAIRRRWQAGPSLRMLLSVAALLTASAPVATLSGWWASPAPTQVLLGWTVAVAGAVAAGIWLLQPVCARLVPDCGWRAPLCVAAVIWLLHTVDGLLGTPLQIGSPLASSWADGTRFFGFSNIVFSVYAVSAVITTAGLFSTLRSAGRRRLAWGLAISLAVVTLVVNATPRFGADAGGIIPLTVAFIVALMLLARRQMRLRHWLLAGLLSLIATALFAGAAWLSSSDSHLGRFASRLFDGDAWGLVSRKMAGAWATVASIPGLFAVALLTALVWALLAPGTRPWTGLQALRSFYQRRPDLRAVVVALSVVLVLGSALNDSGIVVAAWVVMLAAATLATGFWGSPTPSGNGLPQEVTASADGTAANVTATEVTVPNASAADVLPTAVMTAKVMPTKVTPAAVIPASVIPARQVWRLLPAAMSLLLSMLLVVTYLPVTGQLALAGAQVTSGHLAASSPLSVPSQLSTPSQLSSPHSLGASSPASTSISVTAGQLIPDQAVSNQPVPSYVVAGQLVIIGTQGLRWSDIQPGSGYASSLASILSDGADAAGVALSTGRAARCAGSGWLTMSAGSLAEISTRRDPATGGWACPVFDVLPQADGTALVADWDQLVALQEGSSYGAQLGRLGSQLQASSWSQASSAADAPVMAQAIAPVTAVGPGAAVALANADGHVARYRPLDAVFEPGSDVFDSPVVVIDAGSVLRPILTSPSQEGPSAASQADADNAVIEGAVTEDADRPQPEDQWDRDLAVRQLDTSIDQILAAVPPHAQVLLVDLGQVPGGRAALGVAMAWQHQLPAFTSEGSSGHSSHAEQTEQLRQASPHLPSFLTSGATRAQGVIRVGDLPATILTSLGLPIPAELFIPTPVLVGGQRPVDAGHTAAELSQLTSRDHTRRDVYNLFVDYPFNIGIILAALVALVAAIPRLRDQVSKRPVSAHSAPPTRGTGPAHSAGPAHSSPQPHSPALRLCAPDTPQVTRRLIAGGRLPAIAEHLLLALSCLPAAAILGGVSQWWRFGPWRASVLLVSSLLAAGAVYGLALLIPRRPPWARLAFTSGLAWLLFTFDALFGTPLVRVSPLGSAPTFGARFFGFSNPVHSFYTVVGVITAATVAMHLISRKVHRLLVLAAASCVAAITLVVNVWPSFGADFGGVVLVPAFVIVVIAAWGSRLTVTRFALWALAGGLVISLVSLLDWMRPPGQRTHLGGFVELLVSGQAGVMLVRKASFAWNSIFGGATVWITAVILALTALAMFTPARLRPQAFRAHSKADTRAWPLLKPAVMAIWVALVLGSIVNDYGVRIAMVALVPAVPMITLAYLQQWRTHAEYGEH